eukprot:1153111-Pyramimonas_sp.AAC.1
MTAGRLQVAAFFCLIVSEFSWNAVPSEFSPRGFLGRRGTVFGGSCGPGAGGTPKGARVKNYTFHERNERFVAS